MSGQRPPDWGDPDEVDAEAEQADAGADARLSDVTAYLAALPDPVLPDAVAARISAAIAAEAADRAEAATISGRTLGPPPRRPKVRRHRRFRVQAISSVAACLVLAGFGYLLTQLGGVSSGSSSAISAPAASSAPHSEAEPANGENFNAIIPGSAAEPTASATATASPPPSFTVTARGDVYQKSNLGAQVRERLTAPQGTATASAGAGEPSSALVGCVLRVTGGAAPSLVDEATYAGEPVYVIAVPSHVWVVGRGCTATDPELITSVSIAGLRGNLSALGSVEG
jgi:hypothetical protein